MTNVCAVCPKPIRHGYLMCLQHWKLVPAEQQREVYRSLGRWQRCAKPLLASGRELQREYYAARDVAIASAQAALEPLQVHISPPARCASTNSEGPVS